LAAQTISRRLANIAPLRTDLIGVTSVWGNDTSDWLTEASIAGESRDVRLRMAWQHADHAVAARLPREINALYCCGPAGEGRSHPYAPAPGNGVVPGTSATDYDWLPLDQVASGVSHELKPYRSPYRVAHGRTGDKGNRSNISVIAWHPDLWEVCEQVTEQAVMRLFADRKPSHVRRYLLPKLHAMNLVLDNVLDGGQ
jgi:hypothetical protein